MAGDMATAMDMATEMDTTDSGKRAMRGLWEVEMKSSCLREICFV